MLNQTEHRPINNEEVTLPEGIDRNATHFMPLAMLPRSPMDLPAEHFSQALIRREDNRRELLNWIKSNLQPNIDFGQIHVVGKDNCRLHREGRTNECLEPRHWSKASLWKPGAEKICGLLGLIPRFPNLSEFESAALKGIDIKVIIIKCELHTGSGFVSAEGTGARRVAQDNGDINKALKMAEKSAHIDATLRLAGLSELFTQDLEDMRNEKADIQPDRNNSQYAQRPNRRNQNRPQRSQPKPPAAEYDNQPNENGQNYGGGRITSKQHTYIMDMLSKSGMTIQQLNAYCIKVYGSGLDYISRTDASSLIDWLKSR